MKTTALDEEMNNYFMQLNETEKKSVVQLIKTFLTSRKEIERISIEQYNKEIEEAEAEIENGNSFTHDDVVKMSSSWPNDK
ncbi:MAG: hypothetical protein JO072_04850 [Parafilimonas sp.]|nr:hypothetical protein [Parafilimonas sp.]